MNWFKILANNKLALLAFLFFFIASIINTWLSIYIFVCAFVIIVLQRSKEEPAEKKLLIRFFLFGLFLRLLIGGVAHLIAVKYGNGLDIFGDGMAFAINGRWISAILSGVANKIPIIYDTAPDWEISMGILHGSWGQIWPHLHYYQVTLWGYILGFLYRLFGFRPFIGISINILLGTLLSLNLYFITRYFLKDKLSKRMKITSLLLFNLFPTIFLWSITNMKDMSVIYLLSLFMLFVLKYLETARFKYMAVAVVSCAMITSFRYEMLYPLLVLIAAYIYMKWFFSGRAFSRRLSLLILAAAGLYFLLSKFEALKRIFFSFAHSQLGHINTEGTVYHILPSYYYSDLANLQVDLVDFIILFINGWFHMLFEPLPHRFNKFSLMAYQPINWIWYILLFFSVLGAVYSLRSKRQGALGVLIFIFIIGSLIAFASGNIGTNLRMRDMITPFILVFSIIGIQGTPINNKLGRFLHGENS